MGFLMKKRQKDWRVAVTHAITGKAALEDA